MKAFHPKYYDNAVVTCACGATFTTGSTQPEIKVEICSNCHPFFTGEMKYVDTLGRVERFQVKQKEAAGKEFVSKKEKRRLKRKQEETEDRRRPQTLREMLGKK